MLFSQDDIKKIKQLIIFSIFIIAALWKYEVIFQIFAYILKIFFPFLLGGTIAFVLNVPMNFIERKLSEKINSEINSGKKESSGGVKTMRSVSLLIVMVSVLCIFGMILFVLIPKLIHTFQNVGEQLDLFFEKISLCFEKMENQDSIFSFMEFNINDVRNVIQKFFISGTGNLWDSTFKIARSVARGVVNTLIAIVFAIYLLLQKETIGRQIKKVLYAFFRKGRVDAFLEVMSLTYHTFSGFLTGQCLEAVILGSLFIVVLLLFRIPYALLIGILITFTALVPVFGALAGCLIGTFLIFVTDPMKALGFIIIFIILQQIEGNFIYPHVVGNSVGLPSIWVLAAVTLGGNLMGITGMLIFIPVVSVLYALFREIVYLKLKKSGIKPEDISYF